MIDMTAYKIDAVGPPWRYVLRKDGEPVYVFVRDSVLGAMPCARRDRQATTGGVDRRAQQDQPSKTEP